MGCGGDGGSGVHDCGGVEVETTALALWEKVGVIWGTKMGRRRRTAGGGGGAGLRTGGGARLGVALVKVRDVMVEEALEVVKGTKLGVGVRAGHRGGRCVLATGRGGDSEELSGSGKKESLVVVVVESRD